jgi:raffinose/stachyose/melibiose transport system substrate-binding protein
LTNATASGKLPDIFHTWGGKMLKSLIEKGEVYDLTQDLSSDRWREAFIPASLDCYNFDGGSYAVPVTFGAVSFYYNKEIFINHNLSVPQDFDDLIDLCRKLRRKGTIPISLGNKEGWEGDFFFTYLASRIGGDNLVNSILERAPGFHFTDSCLVETGEKIQQLVDTRAFPENFNELNYYQQRRLFWEQKAAMQLNGNRLISKFLDIEAPELMDKLDFFNFPLVSKGKGHLTTIQGGSQLSFAISSNCRNKKKAIGFLHEVTGPRTAEDIITKAQDIPARKGIITSKVFNPLLIKVIEELDKAKKVQIHFFRSLPPTLSRIYLKTLRSIFAKTITPEEGVNAVEEAAQDLDKRNNWL